MTIEITWIDVLLIIATLTAAALAVRFSPTRRYLLPVIAGLVGLEVGRQWSSKDSKESDTQPEDDEGEGRDFCDSEDDASDASDGIDDRIRRKEREILEQERPPGDRNHDDIGDYLDALERERAR